MAASLHFASSNESLKVGSSLSLAIRERRCQHYDIKLSDKEFLAKPLYPKPFVERVGAILDEGEPSLPRWVSKRLDRYGSEAAPHGHNMSLIEIID